MEPYGHAAERSRRRRTKREDALILVASCTEIHPAALAEALGVDTTRLRWILFGHPPAYSEILSPIALGWLELIRTPQGLAYHILPRGRAKARQLTARKVRDGGAARGRAAAAGQRVQLHLPPGAPSSDPTPGTAPTASVSWTLQSA